jgi:Zn-dependent protease
MSFNLNLGKLFGIPIYIHWTWWLFLALQAVISLDYLPVMIVMFGIVLMHEYGHCFAARYFGFGIDSITLHIMGGLAQLKDGRAYTPKEEFWIILCGPLVNFVLVFPLYFLGEHSEFCARLFLLNLFMLVFNLLPAFPLDGAKIGRSVFSWLTKNERLATMTFVWITRVIAVAIGVFSLAAPVMNVNSPYVGWLMIIAVLAWIGAEHEIGRLPPQKRRQIHAPTQESLDILSEARKDLQKIRRKYNRS